MGLIGSRLGLRHRAAIERDASAGSADEWGTAPAADWQPLATVPCRAWTDAGREQVGDRTAVVIDRRMSVPLGTDITEADRIAAVTDAAGQVVFEGPMAVEAVLAFEDHLEVMLERVR